MVSFACFGLSGTDAKVRDKVYGTATLYLGCVLRVEAMHGLWRPAACWSVSTLFAALAFLFPSVSALAQSSVGHAASAATGRSLADAVEGNQKQFVDREGPGSSSRGSAIGIGTASTGRLRASDHDGLKPSTGQSFSWETDEASVFSNVVTTVPGTVLGGQLKLSAFAGQNWLSLDLKSNPGNVLDPAQFGGAKNESILVGGSALWAAQGTYALVTVVGMWGETTLSDSIDDCTSPVACGAVSTLVGIGSGVISGLSKSHNAVACDHRWRSRHDDRYSN